MSDGDTVDPQKGQLSSIGKHFRKSANQLLNKDKKVKSKISFYMQATSLSFRSTYVHAQH